MGSEKGRGAMSFRVRDYEAFSSEPGKRKIRWVLFFINKTVARHPAER
jgi:hypothetical protein